MRPNANPTEAFSNKIKAIIHAKKPRIRKDNFNVPHVTIVNQQRMKQDQPHRFMLIQEFK